MRLIRNQMLALVGHKPTVADELPSFARQYPLLAAALGLAPPADSANAQRIVGALERLSAVESTRVDAA